MLSLLFIRHGTTKGNLEKRYIGKTDEPLCDLGIEQAMSLKEKNFSADFVFTSPLTRTIQTASIVFPDNKLSAISEFSETDFGIFEGKTANELSENSEYRRWVEGGCKSQIPNGESVSEFKLRCVRAFENVIKALPDNSKVAFVLHGGVIMSVLESFAIPKRDFYDYHLKNGEYLFAKYENNCIQLQQNTPRL